ncbi:PIN domain-containing protein [Bacillus sp. YP1]|uniref:PIN domain-containing protein n=1 Tax=Bacillus sp. YP1 TaxID=1574141 RepID=UPI0005B6683D|nr:PIN domain-containing protein [Bacillus sp. YP1]AJO60806.1 hypothetical protein QF06_20240 [Bacillus sp. YP1]
MNFFLDTNILFSDPFLRNNHNKQLIEMVRMSLQMDREFIEDTGYDSEFLHERSKIYISSVVYAETKNKYFEKIDELFSHFEQFNDGIKDYMGTEKEAISPYTKEQCQQQFDQYYDELRQEGIIEILEPHDNLMKDLIERAINRKAPFFDGKKKNEFRDAVFWLTYSSFVKENRLENCYFITNNVNDFFDITCIDSSSVLHPELLKDCDNFILYRSIKDLVNKDERFNSHRKMHNEIFHHINENMENMSAYIRINNFKDQLNNEDVLNLLNEFDHLLIIRDEMKKSLNKINSEIAISPFSLNINDVHATKGHIRNLIIKEKLIVEDLVLISADLNVTNIVSANYHDIHTSLYQVEFTVPISFFVDLDSKISNFECDSANIEKTLIPTDQRIELPPRRLEEVFKYLLK